jgi:hypothetical protein
MKIKLYPFRVFDMKTGSNSVVNRFSTPEFIRAARGEPIDDGAREFDEALVDGDGRLLIDPHSDSARLLKELSGLGGKAAISGNKDRRAMEILTNFGLVTYSLPANDIVDYAITDLGRLLVAELWVNHTN